MQRWWCCYNVNVHYVATNMSGVIVMLVVLLQCQWCYYNISAHFGYVGIKQLNGFLFVILSNATC